MQIEAKIKDYIDNFYEQSDLLQLTKYTPVNIKDDTVYNDSEYLSICNHVLVLLKNSNLTNKYRIEIDKSCTDLIKNLFKTYTDENTFIVTSSHDHQATTNMLGDKKKYIVNLFRLQNKEERPKIFQEIIAAFRESGCKSLFCIMVGTTPQSAIVIDQAFFIELKHLFIRNNIPHLMFLDDCQGIFVMERNYEVFDGFLATGHVLSCLFPNIGLLFTKLSQRIGYINKQTLANLYNKLEIIDKYKDKANCFNQLMSEYFVNNTTFTQYKNEAPHQFALSLRNTINNPKYDSKFIKYGIRFNPIDCEDNFVRLRYHEVLIQDSDTFLKGLQELKTHLHKLSRFKELSTENLDYSLQSREDTQDLTLNVKLNKRIQSLLDINQQELIQQRFRSLYTQQRTR